MHIWVVFLSTLSLRRATFKVLVKSHGNNNFYPRSPCGERLIKGFYSSGIKNFYPRSPCGERPIKGKPASPVVSISIHALLAESDSLLHFQFFGFVISIHALLAESDHGLYSLVAITPSFLSTLSLRRATLMPAQSFGDNRHFYPRSPCGERLVRVCEFVWGVSISIHALLAESDRSGVPWQAVHRDFYPRSPCGERLDVNGVQGYRTLISIHALLAESDP